MTGRVNETNNIVMDSCKDIELHVFSFPYSHEPKVDCVWCIPYEEMDIYEVYKDGVLAASTETGEDIKQPHEFDHDHYTNLFRKKSTRQLMYQDTDVRKFEHHTYSVTGYRKDSSGTVLDTRKSVETTIEVC